jgi:hypothetical protein
MILWPLVRATMSGQEIRIPIWGASVCGAAPSERYSLKDTLKIQAQECPYGQTAMPPNSTAVLRNCAFILF